MNRELWPMAPAAAAWAGLVLAVGSPLAVIAIVAAAGWTDDTAAALAAALSGAVCYLAGVSLIGWARRSEARLDASETIR